MAIRGLRGLLIAFALATPVSVAAETASVPDFSGIWGRNWLYLEPPSLGPGPVVSKLKRPGGIADTVHAQVGDETNPILKSNAAEALKARGLVSLRGEAYPDPHNQCRPQPIPFIFSVEFGMEFIQQKDEIIVLYLSNHEVRHIRMNARHPARVTPGWQGDSVGHYEGDMLVVDTVGQKVGPLAMVDLWGTPFSQSLHVVERYRFIDATAARDAQRVHESRYFPPGVQSPLTNEYARGDLDTDTARKSLQLEIMVDDPVMFTKPWSALVTYRHVLGDWPEAVCAENTREYYASRDTEVPKADKPDF
jgi:hypothetical protein